MFNCTCADCGKDFRTFDPSWWCDDCRKKRFEKHQEKKPQTNADRIRAMSDEELAKEMLFFCPTDTVFKGEDSYEKPHYTGLDGRYYATSEEVIATNLEWLKQPAEVE